MARIIKVRKRTATYEQLLDAQEQRNKWREAYQDEHGVVLDHLKTIEKLKLELESSKGVIETMTRNAFEDQKRHRETAEILHKRLRSHKDHVRIALGICQRARKSKRKAKGVQQAIAVLEAAVDEEAERTLDLMSPYLLRALAIGGNLMFAYATTKLA